jgi:hypothetical protein
MFLLKVNKNQIVLIHKKNKMIRKKIYSVIVISQVLEK